MKARNFVFISVLILGTLTSLTLIDNANLAYTSGQNIIVEDSSFKIKAISYNTDVEERFVVPKKPSQDEYEAIKKLNFNTVKILLSYADFEKEGTENEYDEMLWPWIQEHIKLAKNNDLKIILTLHIPPGGHQSSPTSNELWMNSSRQLRVMRYWYNISLRFKNESTILGYELMDDPAPNFSIGQWRQLAKNTINDIRGQGDNHIIFLHNAVFKEGQKTKQDPDNYNFPIIENVKNVVYTFDYWNNKEYTWQRVKGQPYNNDNEFFPDPNKFTYPEDLEVFYTTDDNTRIGHGTNELAFTEGKRYHISDSNTNALLPVIYSDNLMPGYALYNTIVIKEFSPTGQYLRDVSFTDPNKVEGWLIDTKDKKAKFSLIADYGQLLISIIRIERVETPTRVYNPTMRFVPKFGHYYSVGAHTMTQSLNFLGESYLRFEYERSVSGRKSTTRTQEGIKTELDYLCDWARNKNVPLMISEYGTSHYSFKRNRGGEKYLRSMLSNISDLELNACFSSLDSEYFGIYERDKKGKLKAKENQIKVWKEH